MKVYFVNNFVTMQDKWRYHKLSYFESLGYWKEPWHKIIIPGLNFGFSALSIHEKEVLGSDVSKV